jgi:glycosyltransferase involved in cell wall biosynthesis
MRILYLCHYFHPEIGAPSARALEMAREWIELGHEIDVVTCFPNHPNGIVAEAYRGRLYQREELEGMTIHRNYVYATPNRGFLRKAMGHLSFMVSSVAFSLFRVSRPDVIVVSSPTFFSVLSAYVFSRVRRVPYVFEVRDLWPAAITGLGMMKASAWPVWFLERLEMFLYRKAARVVTVTESFRKNISERGIDVAKIEVITNGADVDFYHPRDGAEARRELDLEERFVVLYIGAHGVSQALHTVLHAAELARDVEDIHFLLVGEGAEKDDLEVSCERMGLTNVTFMPGQPKDRVPAFYAAADVCLVPLRDIPLFGAFIPSKMFEIMASGKAIVASVEGEARQILEESGAAVVVKPGDAAQLTTAIVALRDDTSKRRRLEKAGPPFVARHYSRTGLARRYIAILQAVSPGDCC